MNAAISADEMYGWDSDAHKGVQRMKLGVKVEARHFPGTSQALPRHFLDTSSA